MLDTETHHLVRPRFTLEELPPHEQARLDLPRTLLGLILALGSGVLIATVA